MRKTRLFEIIRRTAPDEDRQFPLGMTELGLTVHPRLLKRNLSTALDQDDSENSSTTE